ncbi:uncharacterized protein LOC142237510 [Haematobia irritans]|uniref:uncharacterized protein LOC142237510 n=1 Tax=Haematobia irritans TaxID=7368 RepID=UPI003F505BB2
MRNYLILILNLSLTVCGDFPNFNYMQSPSVPSYHNSYDYYDVHSFSLGDYYYNYNDEISFGGFTDHDSIKVIDYSQGCSNEYEPVCASNGQVYMHFKNPCELHERNYQELINGREEFIECSMSFCFPRCKSCPNKIEPVCARNMKTHKLIDFQSYCHMEFAGCSQNKHYRFEYPGKCFPQKQCPRRCPNIYKPICAYYGKEYRDFANTCELQRSRCESKIDWKISYHGVCSPYTKGYSSSNNIITNYNYKHISKPAVFSKNNYVSHQPIYPVNINYNDIDRSPVYPVSGHYNQGINSIAKYGPAQNSPYYENKGNYHHGIHSITHYGSGQSTLYTENKSYYDKTITEYGQHPSTNYGYPKGQDYASYKNYEISPTVKPFRLCGELYPNGTAPMGQNYVPSQKKYEGPTVKPFRLCGSLYAYPNTCQETTPTTTTPTTTTPTTTTPTTMTPTTTTPTTTTPTTTTPTTTTPTATTPTTTTATI